MSRIVMAAAVTLVVALPAVQAQAQSIRTFVSVAGSDSNPCTITQPCRHFQAAVNATAVGGQVDALDAGAYGSLHQPRHHHQWTGLVQRRTAS